MYECDWRIFQSKIQTTGLEFKCFRVKIIFKCLNRVVKYMGYHQIINNSMIRHSTNLVKWELDRTLDFPPDFEWCRRTKTSPSASRRSMPACRPNRVLGKPKILGSARPRRLEERGRHLQALDLPFSRLTSAHLKGSDCSSI